MAKNELALLIPLPILPVLDGRLVSIRLFCVGAGETFPLLAYSSRSFGLLEGTCG